MRQTQRQFQSLHASVGRMKQGMSQVTMGAGALGGSLLALTVPVAMGVRSATKFNEGMSGVQAITNATSEDMSRLRQNAVDLSLQTVYTGTQVANAMEILSRAGFNVNEVLGATPGVLAAAAAEGLEMAEAADIISIAVRGMNLDASDAGHVADVLANAAASANTNIRMLGESFVYGAAQASMMNISLEETTAAFAVMADRGVRASMAGTNFSQMLIHLASPSKQAKKLLMDMGLQAHQVSVTTYGLGTVVDRLRTGLEKLTPVQKESALQTLFGIRGMRAGNALLKTEAGRLQELTKQFEGADGAAKRMADTRLKNVSGALKMVGASVEAFWITLEEKFEEPFAIAIGRVIDGLNSIVFGMRAVQAGVADPLQNVRDQMESVGSIAVMMGAEKDSFLNPETAVAIARGIFEAVQGIADAVTGLFDTVKRGAEALGLTSMSEEGIRAAARFATTIALVGAVAGPVLLSVVGLKFAFGGLFGILTGGVNIVRGAIGVVTGLGGGLLGMGTSAAAAGAESAAAATGVGTLGAAAGAAAATTEAAAVGTSAVGTAASQAATPIYRTSTALSDEAIKAEMAAGGTLSAASAMRALRTAALTAPGPVQATATALGEAGTAATTATGPITGAAGALRGLGAAGTQAAGGTAAAAAGLQAIGAAAARTTPATAKTEGALIGAAVAAGRFGRAGSWIARGAGAAAGSLKALGIVGAIVGVLLLLLQKRGESTGEMFGRIGGAIASGFGKSIEFVRTTWHKLSLIFGPVIDAFMEAVAPIGDLFRTVMGDVLGMFGQAAGEVGGTWMSAMRPIADVLVIIFKLIGVAIKGLVVVGKILWAAFRPLVWLFIQAGKYVAMVLPAMIKLFAEAARKVGEFGVQLVNWLLTPMRTAAGILATILDSISGIAKKIGIDLSGAVQGLRELSESEISLAPTHPVTPYEKMMEELYGGKPKSLEEQLAETIREKRGEEEGEEIPPIDMTHVTNVEIDGQKVAVATEKYRVGIRDRAGAKTKPWQRRSLIVRAVDMTPVRV